MSYVQSSFWPTIETSHEPSYSAIHFGTVRLPSFTPCSQYRKEQASVWLSARRKSTFLSGSSPWSLMPLIGRKSSLEQISYPASLWELLKLLDGNSDGKSFLLLFHFFVAVQFHLACSAKVWWKYVTLLITHVNIKHRRNCFAVLLSVPWIWSCCLLLPAKTTVLH